MFRKKLMGVLLAGAVLAAGAGLTVPNALSASAQTQLDTSTASLFLPESYEQYLSLEDPVDIAVCGRYIAIAEEQKIYLFDRNESSPTYHIYTHSVANEEAQISKIQFSDDEKLYFSDRRLGFYELNLSNLEELSTNTEDSLAALTTFYIEKDTVFEVNVTQSGTTYYTAFLSSPKTVAQFATSQYTNTPQLGYFNGTFYSVVGPLVTVYSYQQNEGKYTATSSFTLQSGLSGLKAATVIGDSLYYSVESMSTEIESGIYCCDLKTQTYSLAVPGSGFGALTSYNGKLYAVKGNGVMEYSLENGIQKTDFEISSASDSVNRLNTATDSARAGDLLVTADAGNHRLSVYDMKKDTYTVLSLSYAPTHAATDGEIIAASSDKTVYVYVWNNRSKSYECMFSYDADYPVTGLSCLYGTCYFVTNGFSYGVIGADAEGKYALEGPQIRTTLDQSPPAALTSDLYGNLYVVRSDGSVFKYTEENFAEKSLAQGERLETTLPTGFSCVRADFEGHLYCLSGNTLYQGSTPLATIEGTDFVYSEEETLSPLSFALGFEDDCVYFNFGNFMVKTAAGALGISSHGRLSDAQDIVRAGDLLVTADTGNSRITVYDMKKRSFAVIQTDFSPTLVATDGSVIAAADGNKVYVCEDPSKNQTFGKPVIADLGTIKGLACVHGSVYYITEYGYGKVEEEDFGLVSRLEGSLAALTVDANGILYVVDTSGHVRYFYEEEFIDPAIISGGDTGLTLHMPISSLRADCKGDLYYIHENEIWKNKTPFFKIDDNFFAYDEESKLISFALGFEDDEVFLLYRNRIIKTAPGALDIPTQDPPTRDGIKTFISHFDALLPRDKGRRYYL